MKIAKRLFAVLLAAMLVVALGAPALAAGTGTITINNATVGNTYKVYKVFEANGDGTGATGAIIYTLVEGKTTAPTGFAVGDNGHVTYTGDGTDGELTSTDIENLATYITSDSPVDTKTADSDKVEFTGLSNGYYYITTTTGTVVTVTSTNPNASVEDKNEAPALEKNITAVDNTNLDKAGKDALAQIGSTVSYEVTIDVKAGAENYVFHDKMGSGLSYKGDIKVMIGDTEIKSTDGAYTSNPNAEDTITLTFNNDWIKTQVGKTITITYTATINKDALTIDNAKNTATLDYGDENKTNSTTIPDPPTVHTAKITVTKLDGKNQPLAGAGFVLTKMEDTGDAAKTLYYKKNDDDNIIWVEEIGSATEFVTTNDKDGNIIAFDGLGAGTYTLEEKTVPNGYNKAEDTANMTVTIANTDLTADVGTVEKKVTVTNNAGAVLPSTGGIGTTIFYAVGGFLVIAAAVILITRKRMNEE